MRNAYPPFRNQNRISGASPHHGDEDAGWDDDFDAERTSLLEENARLRALVVQLSSLVLKNVADRK